MSKSAVAIQMGAVCVTSGVLLCDCQGYRYEIPNGDTGEVEAPYGGAGGAANRRGSSFGPGSGGRTTTVEVAANGGLATSIAASGALGIAGSKPWNIAVAGAMTSGSSPTGSNSNAAAGMANGAKGGFGGAGAIGGLFDGSVGGSSKPGTGASLQSGGAPAGGAQAIGGAPKTEGAATGGAATGSSAQGGAATGGAATGGAATGGAATGGAATGGASPKAFQMRNDAVVMEAEHFDDQADNKSAKTWTSTADGSASGGQRIDLLPNSGTYWTTNVATTAPRVDYLVNFTSTGSFYFWVLGDGGSGADDSCWGGVDDTPASQFLAPNQSGVLGWASVTVSIEKTGIHTVSIWGREDGFRLDKIVLNKRSTAPNDSIAESSRQ